MQREITCGRRTLSSMLALPRGAISGRGVAGCPAPALLTHGLPSFCENATRGQQAPCAHRVPAAEHSDKPRGSSRKGTDSSPVPSGAADTEFPPNTTARAISPRPPLRLHRGTSPGSLARRPAAPGTGAPGPAPCSRRWGCARSPGNASPARPGPAATPANPSSPPAPGDGAPPPRRRGGTATDSPSRGPSSPSPAAGSARRPAHADKMAAPSTPRAPLSGSGPEGSGAPRRAGVGRGGTAPAGGWRHPVLAARQPHSLPVPPALFAPCPSYSPETHGSGAGGGRQPTGRAAGLCGEVLTWFCTDLGSKYGLFTPKSVGLSQPAA